MEIASPPVTLWLRSSFSSSSSSTLLCPQRYFEAKQFPLTQQWQQQQQQKVPKVPPVRLKPCPLSPFESLLCAVPAALAHQPKTLRRFACRMKLLFCECGRGPRTNRTMQLKQQLRGAAALAAAEAAAAGAAAAPTTESARAALPHAHKAFSAFEPWGLPRVFCSLADL